MQSSSILILCKNEAANIGPCLDAVFKQRDCPEYEVIVIDSGSTDGTQEIAQKYPVQFHQIPDGTFHHSRTRNYAAQLALGEILVYLAADAWPTDERWLILLLSNFTDSDVGAVYGRHLPKPGAGLERVDALDAVYGPTKVIKDAASREKLGFRYYHMSTVNAAIRKSVWQATGFPEELKVFEDLGIAKKILDHGWKIIYEPQASVYHSHRHTTSGLFKRYFDIGYTFRELKIWGPSARKSLVKVGWRLVTNKFSRLGRSAPVVNVGASFTQELAKSAGMFLGLNQHLLPLPLKRRLSAFRVFE
jgi:glycosyltransferase involved in cell wall biosynthesis